MTAPFTPDPSWPTIIDLATERWGSQNKKLSGRDDIRFGDKGSKSVKPSANTWFDHETGTGGGYIELYRDTRGELPPRTGNGNDNTTIPPWDDIDVTYDYPGTDADNRLIQVVRTRSKDPRFRQRQRLPTGKWKWSVEDIPDHNQRLYRLAELRATASDERIWICAGEKDTDRLHNAGLTAVTNIGGEGKWRDAYAEEFRNRHCVALQDNDETGAKHVAAVAQSLAGIASSIKLLLLPDLPPKGDVSDWLDAANTLNELNRLADAAPDASIEPPPGTDEARETQQPKPNSGGELIAAPWTYRDPTTMQPRPWLLGTLLMLGELTTLGSTGGVGKTSLAIASALACITGRRDIMGLHVFQRIKVWFLTLEDDRAELERRIAAAMLAHTVQPQDIEGQLFVSSARERPLLLATTGGDGNTFTACPDAEALEQEITNQGIGLTIIDPLIKAHGLIENNNNHMDKLAGLITDIGHRTGSAMLAACHFRKGNSRDDSRDAFRGGSALVDAARIARTVLGMAEEEAKQFDISPDDASDFIRLADAKANMARHTALTWFRLHDTPLGNINVDPKRPAGDHVQAVKPWSPPTAFEGLSLATIADIFDNIRQGPAPDEFWTPAQQATDWVGNVFMNAGKGSTHATKVIKVWLDNGVLVRSEYNSPKRYRRKVARVTLDEAKAAAILAGDTTWKTAPDDDD